MGSALRYSGVIPVWILMVPFGASVNTSGFRTPVPQTAITSGASSRMKAMHSGALMLPTTSVGTSRE